MLPLIVVLLSSFSHFFSVAFKEPNEQRKQDLIWELIIFPVKSISLFCLQSFNKADLFLVFKTVISIFIPIITYAILVRINAIHVGIHQIYALLVHNLIFIWIHVQIHALHKCIKIINILLANNVLFLANNVYQLKFVHIFNINIKALLVMRIIILCIIIIATQTVHNKLWKFKEFVYHV